MIQCDEVFEILTRGPFPTGAPSDGIVESHLTHCESCRQLAEALRPAVELFQEAIAPEESRSLPSYWGESGSNLAPWLTAEKTATRSVARRTLSAPQRPRAGLKMPSSSLRPAARLMAAVVLGMALAGLLRQLGSADRALGLQAPVVVSDAHEVRWRLPEDGRQWFRRQGLNLGCLKDDGAPRLTASLGGDTAAAGAMQLGCCSSCHSAKDSVRTLSPAATSIVANACKACHLQIE